MRGLLHIRLITMGLACVGAVAALSPAAAQGSYSPYNESPAAAMARYVRALASDPKDFSALIGAGKAALEMGDAQAAAGFFARADEVNPRSPLPQAGMGAVSVANGEPQAALPYFTRAQQLGAPLATIGCDRGLAYDLLGRQTQAQADYRAALGGLDSEEARRRLALSLAISGDKTGALQTLAPLAAKGDSTTNRIRAFVLALTGDSQGAILAINAAMPGSSSSVTPFLQRLPALQPGQKAAAVNLGIFPDSSGTAYAYAGPVASFQATSGTVATVDQVYRAPQATSAPPPITQVSYATPVRVLRAAPKPSAAARQPGKVWLQLASGANEAALPRQFERMKSRNRELFEGIPGFVAKSPDRVRLVIGPFRGASDAETLADDLHTVGIDAFQWSNSESDTIVPLGTE